MSDTTCASLKGSACLKMLLLLAALLGDRGAVGYPTGAPSSSCAVMVPSHNGQNPQQSPSPIQVNPQSACYTPGVPFSFSTSGTFRGILCQVRNVDGSTAAIGSLSSTNNNLKTISCGGSNMNAITHVSNNDKISVSFSWTPPFDVPSSVKLMYTVVKSYLVFWVDLSIEINQCTSTTTTRPSTTTTRTSTISTTTTATSTMRTSTIASTTSPTTTSTSTTSTTSATSTTTPLFTSTTSRTSVLSLTSTSTIPTSSRSPFSQLSLKSTSTPYFPTASATAMQTPFTASQPVVAIWLNPKKWRLYRNKKFNG